MLVRYNENEDENKQMAADYKSAKLKLAQYKK
jgi:hypothetical protein